MITSLLRRGPLLAAGLIWLTAAPVVANTATTPSAVPAALDDPIALYGDSILFDVYRNGDRVGHHRVAFEPLSDGVVVDVEFKLEIKVLFFTAYRYLYQSTAEWRDGQMTQLRASIDDGDEHSKVTVLRFGDEFHIAHADGAYEAAAPLYPTNHWNAGVLPQTQVLNTITGRINNVAIAPKERERINTETGEIWATRYAYSGELENEVWYDDAGRWVKMRFLGKDGSTIEYQCRRCQGGPMVEAEQKIPASTEQ